MSPMDTKHCIKDIQQLIQTLKSRRERIVQEVRDLGTLTPVQEARAEVGLGLLEDLLGDLAAMETQWKDGEPAYHATELMMEGE